MPVSSEWRSAAKKYLKEPNLSNIKEAYLELTGETNPQSSSLPELKVKGDMGSYTWSVADAHIYEYLWTISLTSPQAKKKGKKEESRLAKRWTRKLRKKFSPKRGWTHMLRKRDAVLIQVFFHTYNSPYLVRVLTTTLKPPFVIKKTMADKVREALTATRSIRKLARTGVPEKFGTLLDAVEIMAKDSVPNYYAYPWYSKNITAPEKGQERGLEGVEFRLDRRVFRNIGNRVMGSLGIMFICKSELKGQKHPLVKFEARAIICFEESKESKATGRRIWIPEKKGFGENAYFEKRLFLEVNPKPPKSK